MKSTIIICDDYGLDASTDLAIIDLCKANKIDGFSVLMTHLNKTIPKEIVQNFQIGLHLNLTEGYPTLPPETVPTLIKDNGKFKSLRSLTFGLIIGTVNKDEIEAEILFQLKSFLTHFSKINHIDGHQHIQYHPFIYTILYNSIRKLNVDDNIRIRHSYFRYSYFSVKYMILNLLFFINRCKGKQLIHKKYITDYKFCLDRNNCSLEDTELFLHVSHPSSVSANQNSTTFQYQDRVNQYNHRLHDKDII